MGDNMSYTFGILESAPDNTIVSVIYDYIHSICSIFVGKNGSNENELTNEFCKLLSSKKPPEYSFYFQHQNLESSSKNTSTDFAIFGSHAFTTQDALIKFEAKRLSSSLPANRKKEYVCGEYNNKNLRTKNSGGIERFKNRTHGSDVKYAGFIGYLQTGTKEDWFQKINAWINEQINGSNDKDLLWDTNDLLVKMPMVDSKDCYYASISSRADNSPIHFKHFWIICEN